MVDCLNLCGQFHDLKLVTSGWMKLHNLTKWMVAPCNQNRTPFHLMVLCWSVNWIIINVEVCWLEQWFLTLVLTYPQQGVFWVFLLDKITVQNTKPLTDFKAPVQDKGKPANMACWGVLEDSMENPLLYTTHLLLQCFHFAPQVAPTGHVLGNFLK